MDLPPGTIPASNPGAVAAFDDDVHFQTVAVPVVGEVRASGFGIDPQVPNGERLE